MKLKYIILLISILCFSKIAVAQTIVVVNIQYLIDNNQSYLNTLKEIEISQQNYLEDFNETEIELKKILKDLEDSKLILNDNEITSQIENYNNQLTNFSILVEEFNLHYQNQIIKIRESVLKEIVKLLEKYAIENKIDLILDSTSYLIASNSIDITENINNNLKKIKFTFEYNDF